MHPIFLELVEGVGMEPTHLHERDKHGDHKENPKAGELGPLVRQGLPIPVPVQTDAGDVITQIRVCDIEPAPEISAVTLIPARIIPGTRMIETISEPIAAALLQLGVFRICDPPATEQPRKPRHTAKKEGSDDE